MLNPIPDKLTVVIDLGAAYTKFGFTGEFAPRCIIRSEIKCKHSNQIRKITDYKNELDLYDMLVDFLHILYFKHALFSPKDRAVVIVESLLCPTIFRETLAKVLFCYYEVSSIFILPSHLVSLCTLALDTAIVVDIGDTEAVAIPVCHGIPTLHAWQALPIAANAIHNHIRASVNKDNMGVEVKNNEIEDIKVRCCFVTTMERSKRFGSNSKDIEPCPSVQYPLGGHSELKISGRIRETSFDVLFEEDNDHQSLPSMILDAILKCSVDLRKPLAENILVIGGTTMMAGFKSRLKEELYDRVNSEQYKNKLHVEKFKFLVAPAKENYTAWLGAAIYGCTEFLSMKSLSRDAYFKEKRVPDWVNMLDNQNRAL